jgi:transcriptional regulator with XRE-family HTH domain
MVNKTGFVVNRKGFGLMLKTLRMGKDLTQKDLSIATGIDRSSIGEYEAGITAPSQPRLETLNDFFHFNFTPTLYKKRSPKRKVSKFNRPKKVD